MWWINIRDVGQLFWVRLGWKTSNKSVRGSFFYDERDSVWGLVRSGKCLANCVVWRIFMPCFGTRILGHVSSTNFIKAVWHTGTEYDGTPSLYCIRILPLMLMGRRSWALKLKIVFWNNDHEANLYWGLSVSRNKTKTLFGDRLSPCVTCTVLLDFMRLESSWTDYMQQEKFGLNTLWTISLGSNIFGTYEYYLDTGHTVKDSFRASRKNNCGSGRKRI